VAGLDAGLVYNTWPMMADRWIPSDLLALTPKWKNIFENGTTAQFNHRHLVNFLPLTVAYSAIFFYFSVVWNISLSCCSPVYKIVT